MTAPATGTILEIGSGSGFGLRHYHGDRTVVAIDPDFMMLTRARSRAARSRACVLLVAADAQRLPFRNAAFDSAVAQLAFCTIPHPALALEELRRALRAGGTLRLLEHVRLDQPLLGRTQDWLTPAWKHIAGGCHLNRQTAGDVERAGFAITRVVRHAGGLFQELTARLPHAAASTRARSLNEAVHPIPDAPG